MSEPATLQPTLTGPTPGAVTMRAGLAADLADACQILERVKAAASLAGFPDPSDAAVFRGRLALHRAALTVLQCELHNLTYVPRADGDEAA